MDTIFPHLTSSGPPPSPNEVSRVYRALFALQVKDGTLRPLVLPYHVYGMLFMVVYLCIPHSKNPTVYAARWPVLAIIIAWQIKTLREASSSSMATSFLAGLVAAWGIVWAFTWLVFYRPQWDAKRVQRRKRRTAGGVGNSVEVNGSAKTFGVGSSGLRERKQETVYEANGQTDKASANGKAAIPGSSGASHASSDKTNVAWEYYWQSYPDKLGERIPWVFDLLVNFRGPGWTWNIPPLPPMPPFIKQSLQEPVSASSKTGKSLTGLQRYDTRHELLVHQAPKFIIGYFLLDIVKVITLKDPYFIFGPTTYALPPHLAHLSPAALQFVRNSISFIGVIISVEMILLLPTILILLLPSNTFGLGGEPYYWPTTWGSFSNILDKGLNGLWGSWWHQTFRFAFSAPTNFLIANGYVNARTPAARLVALVFAFGISSALHMAGSYSQVPPTHIWHPPIFFALQALGIFLQSTCCSILHERIKPLPRWLRRAGNGIYAFTWLYTTGPWLADDFARGGVWLYEPIPISVLRGAGFGAEGDGWWCWSHLGVGWYTGRHWWESGIAI